ncbi:MAG: hypothetical protein Q7N95_15305 [Alphaproteobacteria bacterium]|nr:hypothetical protein [Alphaproteobacteria bacterium]
MDLREVKACLEEYCILVANTYSLAKAEVPDGEFREQAKELNQTFVALLDDRLKEAKMLSIVIMKEMVAKYEEGDDSLDGWVDVMLALDKLKVETGRAGAWRDECLRKEAEISEAGHRSMRFRAYLRKLIDERRARSEQPD